MKNIISYFNYEQLSLLSKIGIVFSNDINYSDDELIEIHDKICNADLICFDEKGEPTDIGLIRESIIDIFYDKFDI